MLFCHGYKGEKTISWFQLAIPDHTEDGIADSGENHGTVSYHIEYNRFGANQTKANFQLLSEYQVAITTEPLYKEINTFARGTDGG